jgi:hypothetical protein
MLLIMVEATFANSGAVVEPTATLRRIAQASSSKLYQQGLYVVLRPEILDKGQDLNRAWRLIAPSHDLEPIVPCLPEVRSLVTPVSVVPVTLSAKENSVVD